MDVVLLVASSKIMELELKSSSLHKDTHDKTLTEFSELFKDKEGS